MGLTVFLDIPGTGGCRRRDSLMHIVVYGILLRSSLKTSQETRCQCQLSSFMMKINAYQSMVSLPPKTCMISSLHSFWCSGWQARLYRMKEMPLAVVSWPSNMNVSTSARMSSSESPCWFSSWNIKHFFANCLWCYWIPSLSAPTLSFRQKQKCEDLNKEFESCLWRRAFTLYSPSSIIERNHKVLSVILLMFKVNIIV